MRLINGYNFEIPLRSGIKHDYCFKINTSHNTVGSKGLDYTKAIIVPNNYLGDPFIIDNEEYRRIYRDQDDIIKEFINYITYYKKYIKNEEVPSSYRGAYTYTTLINYHVELDLNSD